MWETVVLGTEPNWRLRCRLIEVEGLGVGTEPKERLIGWVNNEWLDPFCNGEGNEHL